MKLEQELLVVKKLIENVYGSTIISIIDSLYPQVIDEASDIKKPNKNFNFKINSLKIALETYLDYCGNYYEVGQKLEIVNDIIKRFEKKW